MQIFITDWWMCPELYLRRPFHLHASSRLDFLLEERAKEGVQVHLSLTHTHTHIQLNVHTYASILNNLGVCLYPERNFFSVNFILFMQIYILLYKEVTLYLKINSIYSKRRLLNVHENIRVLRHPDHISSGVYLW
jgi:phospholipase D1/2